MRIVYLRIVYLIRVLISKSCKELNTTERKEKKIQSDLKAAAFPRTTYRGPTDTGKLPNINPQGCKSTYGATASHLLAG